jgi:hypothetical protein
VKLVFKGEKQIENKVLRRIFQPVKMEEIRDGGNYIMANFMLVIFVSYYYCD